MQSHICSRRRFLRTASLAAASTPFTLATVGRVAIGAAAENRAAANAKVAIASCKAYGPQEVRAAYDRCFDLLGGVGSLVKGKAVTIKSNLTGTNCTPFLDRHVGETYMTHESTAQALAATLFRAGAKRIVVVESTQIRSSLEETL